MQSRSWVFDLEADNLYLQSTKIWYVKFKTCDNSKSMQVFPHREGKAAARRKVIEWVQSFEDGSIVQGWNILGYDLFMLWKHLDIPFSVGKSGKDFLGGKHVQFQDGYVLSMYLNPNSPKHSLEYVSGGEAAEEGKINYRDSLVRAGAMTGNEPKGHEFSFWHDLIIPYCDRDVDSCSTAIDKLNHQAEGLYKGGWVHPSFRQNQKDYWLYSAQAYSGVRFDVEKAKVLSERIEVEMQKIKSYVDPQLPMRQLKNAEMTFYKQPAKPFTKAGEQSAVMMKWLEKHSAELIDGNICAYGLKVKIESNAILPVQLPMEIEDNAELKQYFLDSGWIPSDDYWNIQKDPDTGKPVRDSKGKVIRTTPKINLAGQLCPNLEKLEGDVPRNVVKFLSYRNRLGVVTGWLNNWRIAFDGRLSAEITGYAPTSRVKHKTVVNCPKADPKVLLGSEMRELFCVDEGNHYVGTDAAALENRTLSHYTYKYDGGAFAKRQTDGDAHCYSQDTQVLTPEGWKRFDELSDTDKVAQWENGEVSFVVPSCIIWQDYEGQMISVKNRDLDFLVTPNHRVLIKNYKSSNLKVKLASKLSNKNSDNRVPIHGKTTSKGIDLSDDQVRFIVAVQADSYQSPTAFRFEFLKERKIERMQDLLSRMGVPFSLGQGRSKLSDNKTKKFYIKKSDVIFTSLGLTLERKFSSNLLNMSLDQCRVFTKEIQHWDGAVTKKGDVVLDTTCEVSCNLVATICAVSGVKSSRTTFRKRGNLGDCVMHRCYISKQSDSYGVALFNTKMESSFYSGKIGCVSVPSTFILVKRNNKICVSGNSYSAFAFFPELHDKFDINADNKDNPAFKSYRNKAKTGAYLLAFGGGAPKLASSLGLSASAGKEAYSNYWEMNEGLGLLKKAVENYFETTGQGKYITAIDGRVVHVRGKNVLLSCLGQGLGAICMSYAACLMDTWLGEMFIDELGRPYYLVDGKKVRRISMVHDEYSWECEDGAQEHVKQLSVRAIIRAGEILKLALPLAAEGKIGNNWKDVH